MGVEFDVPVGDASHRLAGDAGAVDQAHDRHEVAARAVSIGPDQNRVAGREAEIPGGQARPEGSGADVDRLLVVVQARPVPSMARCPIQTIGRRAPEAVTAWSPTRRSSTATSTDAPCRVTRRRVPVVKQTTTVVAGRAGDE